ncbi:MAG: DNA topoisomerase IV subunit A [Spirochaetales bacterium]|nr:DNA topoisomerase IV subunit A [Spirochaetales bacterium]
MSKLKPLMERNFIEYASYVIIDRAIPDIRDGCKPVQRRILNTLLEMHDGKFHKLANVIGETMKLHPHGDVSIGDALVVLANKEYFIEKQGNFGNIITGHDAAAPRYIECRLSTLARENLFNKALTEYIPSYDGRKKEPLFLCSKLPVLLMLGIEGIAVGMSTKILPHNFIELLKAQIKILNKEKISIYPDFLQGGSIDVSEYEDGRGKVRVRANIETKGDKILIIREIPYSTTTMNLISSIESAVQRGKVSISSISDYTTEKVEIELHCSRGATVHDVLPQLYAYTSCEVSISSNILVIKDNHPVEITVTEYIQEFTKQLRNQIKAELEYELQQLLDKKHWLTLEHIFIVNKVYKKLETAKSEEQLKKTVYVGMMPFTNLFIRSMTDDDVKRLLELKIRRISAYDIKKHQNEIDDIVAKIDECQAKLKALTQTTINYIRDLIEKYKDQYKRRTKITTFDSVDKKEVAKADIKLSYDPETGFFGKSIRNQEKSITVSEYDRILVVTADGTYRIMAPPDKVLLPAKLLYCKIFDQEKGVIFTIVYRDNNKVAWGKLLRIDKFITDKVYSMFPPSPFGLLYFKEKKSQDKIKLYFEKVSRAKVLESVYDLTELRLASNASRGNKLHAKAVARITLLRESETPDPEEKQRNGKQEKLQEKKDTSGISKTITSATRKSPEDSKTGTSMTKKKQGSSKTGTPAKKKSTGSPKPGTSVKKKSTGSPKTGTSAKNKSTGNSKTSTSSTKKIAPEKKGTKPKSTEKSELKETPAKKKGKGTNLRKKK